MSRPTRTMAPPKTKYTARNKVDQKKYRHPGGSPCARCPISPFKHTFPRRHSNIHFHVAIQAHVSISPSKHTFSLRHSNAHFHAAIQTHFSKGREFRSLAARRWTCPEVYGVKRGGPKSRFVCGVPFDSFQSLDQTDCEAANKLCGCEQSGARAGAKTGRYY